MPAVSSSAARGASVMVAAFVHEPCFREPGEREVKQAVGAIAAGKAFTDNGHRSSWIGL